MRRTAGILIHVLAAIATLACVPAAAGAATYGPDFDEQALVSGLTQPTTAVWAPDGRLFIAEKPGRVKVAFPGSPTATTILDIADRVNSSYDRGLLGLALDADFEVNHYMYLLYVHERKPLMADGDGAMVSRLTRVEVDNANNVSDETILLGSEDGCVSDIAPGVDWSAANDLDCIPAEGRSHAIGTILSAPDDTLYVGSGDASSYAEYDPLAFRVYEDASMAGKILHVDRDGNGLPGHAFCPADSDLTHVCTKVHSKGFRNPFRFQLRADGSLAVGDVGWSSHEEIDIIRSPGGAYGWPCYEGDSRTPTYRDTAECNAEYAKEGTGEAHVPPNYDYPHTASNAVVGGPTYTGGPYPDSFDGSLFFGDYGIGVVKRVTFDGTDANPVVEDFATDWFGVDLMLTPENEVAYANFGTGDPDTGSIERIAYSPSLGAPKARAAASPIVGGKPLEVDFDSSGSTDADGGPLTYEWGFGDGSPASTAASPTHTYAAKGEYTATLTVTDGEGKSDTDTVDVSVFDSPPTPTIDSPADRSLFRDGDTIQLQGSATDAEDSAAALTLTWNVILHHGSHTHALGTFSDPSPSFQAPTDHDADSYFEIRLRATDTSGEWGQTVIDLLPESRPFSIHSVPTGAPVSYGGMARTAPFSTDSAIGLRTSISAGARFMSGGEVFHFHQWSDGGARTHQIEIPDHASSVSATYWEDKANGRVATASSVEGDPDNLSLVASNAVDDDPSTRWSSEKGSLTWPATSEWWQVDLGSVRKVGAVEVDWESAYASKYEIQTSLDGVSFSPVATEPRTAAGAGTYTTSFAPRDTRYVRIQGLERGTTFGISLYEARVLGPPDDPPPNDPPPDDPPPDDPPPDDDPATEPQPVPTPGPGPTPGPEPASGYREATLDTNGLLGYWPLGDQGRRATDLAGGKAGRYRGRPRRAAALVRALRDGSRRFDGLDDGVLLAARRIGRPRAVSVEAWVAWLPGRPRRPRIVLANARAPFRDGFALAIDPRGRPLFVAAGTGRSRAVARAPRTAPRRAHHLVGVYDGAVARLYVDGRPGRARRHADGIAYRRGRRLLVGRPRRIGQRGPHGFRGLIDEVAIYGRALGRQEIVRRFDLGS